MKATVVYESRWGNTSRIAGAVAEVIGPQVRAVSTAEATAARIAGADLIVAGGHSSSAALDTRVRGPFESAAPVIAEALGARRVPLGREADRIHRGGQVRPAA